MQYFIFLILILPFLYVNFQILKSDIFQKIIPNKKLLFLLILAPLYYIYGIFFGVFEFNSLHILSPLISLFVSFLLYYFGIWSAGDAKYLFVLSLFLPQSHVLIFFGNLGIITGIYLLFYFFLFYGKKPKNLGINTLKDLKASWDKYLGESKNSLKDTFLKIGQAIFFFLVIFVIYRLSRFYVLQEFLIENAHFKKIYELFSGEKEWIFLSVLLIFIGAFFLLKWIFLKIQNILQKKFPHKISFINTILWGFLTLALILFIVYEYKKDAVLLVRELKIIFTFGIIFVIFVKILLYSIKICFIIQEQYSIPIENLKAGDIVDKSVLINFFGTQFCLGSNNPEGILAPSPKDFFRNINVPINTQESEILKNVFSIVNEYHSKNDTSFVRFEMIQCVKSFAFAGFIFCAFLTSFLFSGEILHIIGNAIFHFFTK